jgi:hypothetical protein
VILGEGIISQRSTTGIFLKGIDRLKFACLDAIHPWPDFIGFAFPAVVCRQAADIQNLYRVELICFFSLDKLPSYGGACQ